MLIVHSKEPELRLVEKISSIGIEKGASRVLHFKLSILLDQFKSEYQKKITLNIITEHLKNGDGHLYPLSDGDIFLFCVGLNKNQLDKLVFQLRYLYSDDPLAYSIDGVENPEFCDLYDLSIAYEDLFKVVKKKMVFLTKKDNAKKDNAPVRLKPLTPLRLATLEKELASADLSQVLRRQPVCAIQKDKPPKKLFDELYINIGHLQKLFASDVDLFSSRPLFKYITQQLDSKMLSMLAKRPTVYFESPVSLNLNIDTVLSNEFTYFDEQIGPAAKISLIIEIQAADVIDNMGGLMDLRDAMIKSGYRICLDGLTYLNFIQLDRERLGFDLAKLQWNEELDAESNPTDYWKLKEAILKYGQNRVILCRCDTEKAIEFGHSLGLSLFQGRYVDYLLNPNSKIKN